MYKLPALTVAIGIAVFGLLITIALWAFFFYSSPIVADSKYWADFGSYLGGTLAPILAFASFMGLLATIQHQARAHDKEQLRADDMVYLQSAVKSLERAFATFVGTGHVPISDRLVWLTVARLILSAKSVSQKIGLRSVREMYDAEEAEWRRRFYEVIQPAMVQTPLANASYFSEGEKWLSGYVIDERSIRVIYEFIEWPDGQRDPMEGTPRFTTDELEKMTGGRRGIREFVESRRMKSGVISE